MIIVTALSGRGRPVRIRAQYSVGDNETVESISDGENTWGHKGESGGIHGFFAFSLDLAICRQWHDIASCLGLDPRAIQALPFVSANLVSLALPVSVRGLGDQWTHG